MSSDPISQGMLYLCLCTGVPFLLGLLAGWVACVQLHPYMRMMRERNQQ